MRIELWRIGDSDPAPKFFIESRPNDWTKSVRGSVHQETDLTDTKLVQLEFWQQLREFAKTSYPSIKLRKPKAQHWYDVAIGRSDCHVVLTCLVDKKKVGCELYITNSKSLFKAFYANKDFIEKELDIDADLSWQELPEKKASRIRTFRTFDVENEDRTDAFVWLMETCAKFKKVFAKNWT